MKQFWGSLGKVIGDNVGGTWEAVEKGLSSQAKSVNSESARSMASRIASKSERWAESAIDSRHGKFLQSLVKYDAEGIPNGLSGRGTFLLFGASAAATLSRAADEDTRLSMGTTDGIIRGPAPGIKRYLEKPGRAQAPAGADGSLVFALHNSRNGGYL